MSSLLTTIHIIVCFILIMAVLLQSGKSADLAGAFGGGGSQTVFGPRGVATILSKATTASAVLFMITSLGLWMLSAKGTKSVIRGEEAAVTETEKKETKAPETEGKQQPQQEEKKTEESKKEKK